MQTTVPINFGKEIQWRNPTDGLRNGWYSLTTPVSWEGCRERFSIMMGRSKFKSFYFCHNIEKGENVAKFLYKTEEILDLSEKTTYQKTSCNRILKIHMAEFWLNAYIKRSLFTLLVRLGNSYNISKDNYEETLFEPSPSPANGYANTLPAVKRFLYGFTKYNYPDPEYGTDHSLETKGWCQLFSRQDAWKRLVKEKEKEKLSPIAVGTLWGN